MLGIKRPSECKIFVMDGRLPPEQISEKIIDLIKQNMKESQLIFYIKTTAEHCLGRIQALGRQSEKSYDIDYINYLSNAYEAYFNSFLMNKSHQE